jgi:hypothetical protein
MRAIRLLLLFSLFAVTAPAEAAGRGGRARPLPVSSQGEVRALLDESLQYLVRAYAADSQRLPRAHRIRAQDLVRRAREHLYNATGRNRLLAARHLWLARRLMDRLRFYFPPPLPPPRPL